MHKHCVEKILKKKKKKSSLKGNTPNAEVRGGIRRVRPLCSGQSRPPAFPPRAARCGAPPAPVPPPSLSHPPRDPVCVSWGRKERLRAHRRPPSPRKGRVGLVEARRAARAMPEPLRWAGMADAESRDVPKSSVLFSLFSN